MCLICKQKASASTIGDYVRCQNCQTYIVKELPHSNRIQYVIEDHASKYILGISSADNKKIYADRIEIINKNYKSLKKILDFGCGNGFFVKYLKSIGYRAYAYDKSKAIKKHLQIHSIPYYEELNDIPNNFFDVVTCFDVIEHTTKPQLLIRNINYKLHKNGLIVISTPNSNGISSKILKNKWWVFGPEGHYILFSVKSLKLFLSREGFKILELKTDTLTPWVIPSELFISKILNKIIFILFLPFKNYIFRNNLGDNIQIIAQKDT